jgi:hypothetical protein
MMVKKMQETDTENEIREAYRVFDKERTGRIAVSEMRHILSNLPEKLSHEEIDEMLRTADKVFILIKTFFNFIYFKKGTICSFDGTFTFILPRKTQLKCEQELFCIKHYTIWSF